jgi:hypothetical protein
VYTKYCVRYTLPADVFVYEEKDHPNMVKKDVKNSETSSGILFEKH